MASILKAFGYGPVESLEEFLSSFQCKTDVVDADPDLENIWVCHKKQMNIDKLKTALSNLNHIHSSLHINDNVFIRTEQNQFKPAIILRKLFKNIKCCLAYYIVNECLLLYNWNINSFELIIENHDFISLLLENIGKSWESLKEMQKKSFEDQKSAETGENNCCIFPGEKYEYRHRRRKKYENTLRNLLEEKKKQAGEDSIEGSFNRETFNKGRILYDIKQRRWPKSHALSCGSVNSVLTSIMRVKRNGVKSIENQLLENSNCLKGIFRAILERHKTIVHNDGYGRILKCHLKGFRWAKGSLESISVGAVSSYIIDILRRVIPIEFFGGNRLKKKFMSEVSKIISGSKYEGFIFETLIQMFLEIKDELSWLREIQEFVDARTIILKILIWLILDYVLLIIRNNFYVTDVGSFGYQLYYYRKGDMERAVAQWVNSRLRKKTISLVEGDLEHWDNAERKWIETGRIENAPRICMPKSTEWIFPVSRIRFLPKSIESDELRVITNFKLKKIFTRRRQVKKYKLCQSFFKRIVNRLKMLKKVKGLLQFLVENYGTGITPMPDNPKLKKAWKKAFLLKQLHGKLYFVKADINDAFGSIVPSLLGAIIEEKLKVKSNQVMHLRKIVECRMKYGKIQCRVRESFSDRPKENCLLISRSYLVGKKRKLPSYKSKYLKKILDQIIQNQYMSINGKIYRLTTGVTQGSAGALSALLCEIYCSEMDRLYFTEFMTCSECILLRGVDDYLLITSSPEKAGKFYDIVYNGVKDFNVTFNRSKLKSNINEDISSFRYLGLIFDVKDMTVRPDYSKYGGKDLLSTMKLPYWKDPLSSLGMSSLKLLAITVGNSYTSSAVCREIVFAACHLEASRILVVSRHLFRDPNKNVFDIRNALARSARKITKSVTRFNKDISSEELSWLFWRAALFVFRKYSGLFSKLLVLIRYRLFAIERKLPRELLNSVKKELGYWRGIISTNCKPTHKFR